MDYKNGVSIIDSIESMIDNFSERVLTKHQSIHDGSLIEDFLTGGQRKRIKRAIELEFKEILRYLSCKLEEK